MRKNVLIGLAAAVLWVGSPLALDAVEKSEFEAGMAKLAKKFNVEAMEYVRKHAELGDKSAKCYLGQFYAVGQPVSQDYNIAAKYLAGLDQESCGAASILKGLMYRDGLGFEKDLEKSKFWFRRMALQLGYMNIEDFSWPAGADVTKEIENAQAWHTRLFEKADPQTQYEEALKFLSGDGVIADPDIAHDLLRKAIVAENPEAMYQLGKG